MTQEPVDLDDTLRAVLDDAIARVVTDASQVEGGAMPLRWILVTEYANAEGETWCLRFGSKDSSVWDRMGLLHFGLTCEEAFIRYRDAEGD